MHNEIKYLDSQILTVKSNSRTELCSNPSMVHNVQIIIYERDPQLTFTYYRFNGEKYSTKITYPCIINIKNGHIQYVEFSSSKDYNITFIKQPIIIPISYTSHIANEISVLAIPLSSIDVNIVNTPNVNDINNSIELRPLCYSITSSSSSPTPLYSTDLYAYYFRLFSTVSYYIGDQNQQTVFIPSTYEYTAPKKINLKNIYIKANNSGPIGITVFVLYVA